MSQTDIDTGTQDLLAHIDGNVGAIVFNRPERRNALSNPMYEGFRRVLPRFAEDPEVRVVMITGSGGAFSAGGDVKGMVERIEQGGASAADIRRRMYGLHEWIQRFRTLERPVIAASCVVTASTPIS